MKSAITTLGLRPGEARSIGTEAVISAGVIAVLFVILVPLPSFLVDALLVVNITFSLMVLMTAACVARPLDFSAFPSVLLVATFLRLALNVATTRLILGRAQDDGLSAAGRVVEAFAGLVTGGNLVVGFILFVIIVIVQFVVITKGTTRISEVAARFTLDALPGKQIAIDSDLASGLIAREEARSRRQEVSRESDFYGAMDGASKFVRGEAIAGILILCANVAGGFILGTIYHGMDAASAADVFTRLTVGEGLANQIPALMVSVGAALLVTKSAAGGEKAARGLGEQIFLSDRRFFIGACFLLALLPTGIPKPLLIAGAVGCAAIGLSLRPRLAAATAERDDAEAVRPPPPAGEAPEEKARSLLVVEPMVLEIGYRLVGLVDAPGESGLMGRLLRLRERIAGELGLVLPPVKVRDDTRLHPLEYSIKLRGNAVAHGRVRPDRAFVPLHGARAEGVDGERGVDPLTGAEGIWLREEEAFESGEGSLPRSAPEIIAGHLDGVIRARAAEVLSREEVSRLIGDLRRRAPAIVDELIPGSLRIGDVHKVLQSLLREQVSIRDLETILETLADHAGESRDTAELTEHARRALSRTICGSLAGRDGTIRAIFLDPALEEFLQGSVERTERGVRLALEPELEETLVESVVESLQRLDGPRRPRVLVCSAMVRPLLRGLIARKAPLAAVLAYEEVSEDYRLEPCGSVAVERMEAGRLA
jgi:flagellar biosynthesis protein FlhA